METKKLRKPYKRGAKHFLANMKVGEVYHDDGQFTWRGMQTIAARLEKDLNLEVEYKFKGNKAQGRWVTRVR